MTTMSRFLFPNLVDYPGSIDTKVLLGDVYQKIRSEAQAIVDNWGILDGGLIINDYGNLDAVGVSLERIRWIYDAFIRCDRYR